MVALLLLILLIAACPIPILTVWHFIRMLYWVIRIPRHIPWAGSLEPIMLGKMRLMFLTLTSTSQLAEDRYNKVR